jgi:tetratricopeptide (TPR) repeat protein
MPRIVLAAALLLLSAGVAHADDDFKTCASGAPDYAIMACTNLIEGGKLDARDQSVAYTNRAVAFRKRGTLAALGRRNEAIAEYTKALAIKPDLTQESLQGLDALKRGAASTAPEKR